MHTTSFPTSQLPETTFVFLPTQKPDSAQQNFAKVGNGRATAFASVTS